MDSWPKISLVVPNYNGGATLGATLRSLVEQDYPALEILVADGGSTDDSVAVIQEYARHLTWWVSAKDRGQSHAINKGFARATGEVVNWLCSDDVLEPGALRIVGRHFAEDADLDVLVGAGRLRYAGSDWQRVKTPHQDMLRLMPCLNPIDQPSCFFRRRTLDRPQPVREDLHFCMDLELWCHFQSCGRKFQCIPEVLASLIHSDANKTTVGGPKIIREWKRVYREYCPERISLVFWQSLLRHPLAKLRRRFPGGRVERGAAAVDMFLQRALGKFYGFDRVHALD